MTAEERKTGRREDATRRGRKRGFASSRLLVFPSSLLLLVSSSACGKKAPPLAPLNLAPEAPKAVTLRRLGDSVYLQLTVPEKSMSGRGAFSVDHVDVYAATVAPGMPLRNRDFLKPEHVIAHLPVRPPIDPDAPEPETPDTRPGPGDTITFVEKLTEAQFEPQTISKPDPPPTTKGGKTGAPAAAPPATAVAAPTAPGAAPAAAATPAPAGPPVVTRFYIVQGVPKGGRGGAPSPRLELPLLQPPAPPRAGSATADETSVTVTWQPPPSTTDESPGVLYNVYKDARETKDTKDAKEPKALAPVPLNDKPLAEAAFSHPGAEPGKEQCFVVRSLAAVGTTSIESDPSSPICVTPRDTFPPAPPKGLAAVGSAGVVNLIWDASTEADLAGYIVLRGEAGSATLQPLMSEPIRETRYADRTAAPGTRYAYQIVAVDKAGNRSGPSNRVEEAAR